METSFLNTIRDMPNDFKNFLLPDYLNDAIIKGNKALFNYNENIHFQHNGIYKDETVECGKHLKNSFTKWYKENTTLNDDTIHMKYMTIMYGYNQDMDRIQLINFTLVRKTLYNDKLNFSIKKKNDLKIKQLKELLDNLLAFLNNMENSTEHTQFLGI
jgi:superfamily I DNA and/or RNA helicase